MSGSEDRADTEARNVLRAIAEQRASLPDEAWFERLKRLTPRPFAPPLEANEANATYEQVASQMREAITIIEAQRNLLTWAATVITQQMHEAETATLTAAVGDHLGPERMAMLRGDVPMSDEELNDEMMRRAIAQDEDIYAGTKAVKGKRGDLLNRRIDNLWREIRRLKAHLGEHDDRLAVMNGDVVLIPRMRSELTGLMELAWRTQRGDQPPLVTDGDLAEPTPPLPS